MENELNLTVSNGTQEITIRHAKGLDAVEPLKVSLTGVITSPLDFVRTRKGTIDLNTAVVIVNKQQKFIKLECDPSDRYATVVVGKLEVSEGVNLFQINTSKTFTRDQLIQLIRFNRRFFANRDEQEKFLSAVSKFAVNANVQGKQESDTRGNRVAHLDKVVNTNVPETIALFMPLFQGENPVKFVVDVCIDVSETTARFWFESAEMKELEQSEIDAQFNDISESLAASGLTVIYQ